MMVWWVDRGEKRTDWDRERDKRRKQRGKVNMSTTVPLSFVQDMTFIIPSQSITILFSARVALPASVRHDGKHQSQVRRGRCGVKPPRVTQPSLPLFVHFKCLSSILNYHLLNSADNLGFTSSIFFLSLLSTSYIPFSWWLHPPVSPIQYLTLAPKQKINMPICECCLLFLTILSTHAHRCSRV